MYIRQFDQYIFYCMNTFLKRETFSEKINSSLLHEYGTNMTNNLKEITHHRVIHTFTQLINPTLQLHPHLEIRLPLFPLLLAKFLLPFDILLLDHVDIRIHHIVRIARERHHELRAQFDVVWAAIEDGGDFRGEVFERDEPSDEHFASFVANCPHELCWVEPDAFVHGMGWELVAARGSFIGRVCAFIGRVCAFIGRVRAFIGRVCGLIGRVCDSIGRVCDQVGLVCDYVGRVCQFRGSIEYVDGLLFGVGSWLAADVSGSGRVRDFWSARHDSRRQRACALVRSERCGGLLF